MISKKSRKQLRKELRKQKKARKNEFYTNRNKGKFVLNPDQKNKSNEISNNQSASKIAMKTKDKIKSNLSSNETLVRSLMKEKKEEKKLQNEMKKQRAKQLKRANMEEDRNIKHLEKQLKLNKRKTNSIPKSFVDDGLDFLLEVCDSDNLQGASTAEQQFLDADDDFVEDLALMSGKRTKKEHVTSTEDVDNSDEDNYESDENESFDEEEESEDFFFRKSKRQEQDNNTASKTQEKEKSKNKKSTIQEDEDDLEGKKFIDPDNFSEGSEYSEAYVESDRENVEDSEEIASSKKKNIEKRNLKRKSKYKEKDPQKKVKIQNKSDGDSEDEDYSRNKNNGDEDDDDYDDDSNDGNVSDKEENIVSGDEEKEADGIWEDIYGRLRGKDGSIIQNNERKYIPPAIRAKLENEALGDKKHQEKLNKLKRQLKGLINRLAEANMHKIATEIEQLYMSNSRNDMNETLTNLIMEALISHVLSPERFVLEHVMLIAILHANVGSEIGAHFLQTVMKKFDESYAEEQPPENKKLENIVYILSHLYNFKVFHCKLLYEILEKLNNRFSERDIECILLILKSVGFCLRKDDPAALKNLIISIQKQAANVSQETKENPRVKFMLEILLAIKNNNMTKIPNYDPSYAEHLKKIIKNLIRKGLYVSTLNICLEDLLKADERGKWWVVGSAWSGKESGNSDSASKQTQKQLYSQKLLDLARKQRMNTDTRKSVFCILMSAEDYLDAFEKLLHLGLKGQQEREIIHVLIHCCLQEKDFNPYYSHLAQKFCDYDRRFQMTIKCSVWDKLKALSDCSGRQLSNLAKLLTHLFLEKGLPISTLKIMQFSEMDKITLRFIRQILLGILLYNDAEQCLNVFEKVSHGEKLKIFRESLRLFIKHFLLRNLNQNAISETQKGLLEERAGMVDKLLSLGDKKVRF